MNLKLIKNIFILYKFYDLNELIVDDNKSEEVYECSKDFINGYDESFFETKSLIVFFLKGLQDYRELCYVADCYYFHDELNVHFDSGFDQYVDTHRCSICSFVKVEKIVFPYIEEMKFYSVIVE